MFAAARAFSSYAGGMREFLASTVDSAEARRRVSERLARREEAFRDLLDRAVFRVPASPYRRLLEWAAIEPGDIENLIRDRGVEGTLEALFDAGVTVTYEQLKGRRPIVRAGLQLDVSASDFDNPLARGHWRGSTGGSTGTPTQIRGGFDQVEMDAVYYRLCLEAFGADESRPAGIWLMAPPGAASIQQLFRTLKVGGAVERWWTPTLLSWRGPTARHALFTTATVGLARAAGRRVARPRHLPPQQAQVAARWLAATAAAGGPGVFSCTPSAVARLCTAATEHGLDIAGTLFILGGEPYVPATAAMVGAVGARAASSYYMAELGQVGVACADARTVDDVHLATDVLAVIQRPRPVPGAAHVNGLFYTTLSTSLPKLMLNMESGDFGELEHRRCGCPATDAGLTLHLHEIRSYEKLTLEGTHFLGADLSALVEEILPGRFGGHPHDYQFVEERNGVRARLVIVASPRLGQIDEQELVDAALRHLESTSAGHQKMGETLARTGAVHVRREQPFVTGAGKTPVLRIA